MLHGALLGANAAGEPYYVMKFVEGVRLDRYAASKPPLAEALRLFTLAPSLGGVDSLVSLPVLTSHAMISAEHREKMGVTEQLIRLSVGIENADDLIADLEQALTVLASAPQHAQALSS